MAPIDFICIGIVVLFGLIGLLRGFAKQLVTLLGWFFSLITAILLVPVFFKLLFADGAALASFRQSFEGAFKFFSVAKLDEMALTYGLANGGAVMARWVIMFGLLVILWIVIAIIFKLLKLIIKPLTYKDQNPVVPLDKVLGVILGLAIGAAIVIILIGVLYLLKDKVTAIDDLLGKIIVEDCLTDKIVCPAAEKFDEFLKGLWQVYKTTIPA